MHFWLNLEPVIIADWIEEYVVLLCYRLFISLQLILFSEALIYCSGIGRPVICGNSTLMYLDQFSYENQSRPGIPL
jgi:hypothetical protein